MIKAFLKKQLKKIGLYSFLKKKLKDNRAGKSKKEHEYGEALKFFGQFIAPGDLCFDVGANIGDVTAFYLEIGASIVSIEPQRKCLKILGNRFGSNPMVTIIPKGLSDSEGEIEMAVCDEANTISTMSGKWQKEGRFSSQYHWNKKEMVKLTTLDKLIETYGTPQFVKIDVEGFELQVLKGLSKPVNYLMFEFTWEFLADAKACLDHLSKLGKIEVNCLLEPQGFWLPHFVTPEELINRLEATGNKMLNGDIFVKFFWS